MKIKLNLQPQGSTLLAALLIAIISSLALTSCLYLMSNQNRSVMRSMAWNSAMAVTEAGVEEALTQLNTTTDLTANSWSLPGADGYYHKTGDLGNGYSYEVGIQPNATNSNKATIQCIGYVPAPANSSSSLGMIIASINLYPLAPPSVPVVKRKVQVNVRRQGSGPGGLNTKGPILFSGGGSLDSFDSSDPNYSTGGKYDSAKRKANGLALTDSSLIDAIHVDTAHIYGSTATGPSGTVTVNSGAVGDLAWNASNSGIQSGHFANDANVQFFDVPAPFTYGSGLTPVAGGVGGTNYTYVLGSGNYNLPGGVNIGGGKSMIVTGTAVLYVNGKLDTSGSGFIYIAPGASLQLYISGTGTISGSGVVNGTGYAGNFGLYGLNTSTTLTYSGSSQFIGTVNAPHAGFTFSGAAGASGSFMANSVTISGGAAVHYDEHLSTGRGLFVASSWNEISTN